MKILMLSSSYAPLTGGAETYIRLLAEGLADGGHDVTLVTDGSWLDASPLAEVRPGLQILRLRSFAGELDRLDRVKWRRMQYAVLDELSTLYDDQPEIIHANSHETLLMGAMISLDHQAGLVASLHEQNPDLEPFGAGRCRLSYEVLPVDAFLAASRFYEERALAYGAPRERLRLIYHGVETPDLASADQQAARRRLGVPDDATLVVCAGRIYTRKGQLYLVEAIADLRARFPDVHVLLAGRVSDFDYAERLRRLIEQVDLGDRVTIREDLTEVDMADVYNAADVVAQPSLEEGLGLAAIEAMSWARPVVVSDVIGLNEVVTDRHDGLRVPAQDPLALSVGLASILEDPVLARRLGESARRTVEERFSQAAMVEQTLSVYRDVAESGATSR